MTPAQTERHALVASARAAGADAPTLCGEWTVRDLLAHLIIREGRPDGAAGILLPPLAKLTEKVQAKVAKRDFKELLKAVDGGPPRFSPYRLIDSLANTVEMFVHHEDIRRAAAGWQPRTLDPELSSSIEKSLPRIAKMAVRAPKVAIVLMSESGVIASIGKGPSITVFGAPGELALWVFGRDQAVVTVDGEESAVGQLDKVRRGL